jgi:hypothetical protein
VAYSILADGRKSEEELAELDYQIGMAVSPEDEALEALREHQEAAGMALGPDVPVPAADRDGVPGWMTTDEEIR